MGTPGCRLRKIFEKHNELREPTINIKDQNKPIWETASYTRIKDYNCFPNTTLLSFLGPYLVSTESYLLSLNHLMIHWSKTQIFRILNRLDLSFSSNLDELMENDTLNENLTKNKKLDPYAKNIVELKKIKTRAKIDADSIICLKKSINDIMEINVLCIGLPNVGKTSTICNILDLDKSALESHVTSKKIKDIKGTAAGIKWNFIDTPGMDPDMFKAESNKNILKKIVDRCKKTKPDICLYFDRMDNCRNKEVSESGLFQMIDEYLKPNLDDNIFEDLIVVLTHAESVKELMKHKSYNELFYEITGELQTITPVRTYFNLVENQENDYRKKKRNSWRPYIVERLSTLTILKKMKYSLEKKNTFKKGGLPNIKRDINLQNNEESFMKSLDDDKRETKERVDHAWAIEKIDPTSADKKTSVRERKEYNVSSKMNDNINVVYDTFYNRFGELDHYNYPFMLDVNFNEEIFHNYRSVRRIEPNYIEGNLDISPIFYFKDCPGCSLHIRKIIRPFGILIEGIKINLSSVNCRILSSTKEKKNIRCIDLNKINMKTSLDVIPVLGYHSKNAELQIRAETTNGQRSLVCETKIRDIEGLYDKYVYGLMYNKHISENVSQKSVQTYGAKVGICNKLKDGYEVEMSLGLFKKSTERNSIWPKPNLCRISLKKNEGLFNIEGLIRFGKKKKHNKKKLYMDVERVKLDIDKEIENNTSLSTVIKSKKTFQHNEIEMEIGCRSEEYQMIGGATMAIVIAKLIRKNLKNN